MGSSASYLQETPFSSTVLPYVCPESVLVKRSFLYMNDRSLVKKIPPANRENSAVDVVQMALDVAALPELIVIRVRHQVWPKVVPAALDLQETPFPSTFPMFVPSLSWYNDRF
jgi:hypothetical protein